VPLQYFIQKLKIHSSSLLSWLSALPNPSASIASEHSQLPRFPASHLHLSKWASLRSKRKLYFTFYSATISQSKTNTTSAEEYETLVNKATTPVVVDFFATWCGPCKVVSPVLEKLSNEHTSINFYKVDVDELANVAAENAISAMPTFLFFSAGETKEGEKKTPTQVVKGANPPAIQAGIKAISA
jgi:thioredoxin 1